MAGAQRRSHPAPSARPAAVIDPIEPDHLQITLIDPDRKLEDLMTIALNNRPEILSPWR